LNSSKPSSIVLAVGCRVRVGAGVGSGAREGNAEGLVEGLRLRVGLGEGIEDGSGRGCGVGGRCGEGVGKDTGGPGPSTKNEEEVPASCANALASPQSSLPELPTAAWLATPDNAPTTLHEISGPFVPPHTQGVYLPFGKQARCAPKLPSFKVYEDAPRTKIELPFHPERKGRERQ